MIQAENSRQKIRSICDYVFVLPIMAELTTSIDVVDTNVDASIATAIILLVIDLNCIYTNAAVVVVVRCECCLCEASSWK
jgi:hypothetical protein